MSGTDIALIAIGAVAGVLSGLVGVGGGIIMVPALVLLLGFGQKHAQGTTLAMLLLPVGLFAVMHYYRHGYVNVKASLWLAVGFAIGAAISAAYAVKLPDHTIARIFGGLLLVIAAKMLIMGR
ncbi:MAG TPA: TSUP family transporter [Candidatus Saccharimonadales bacterium]|nr:TSUP family transporter [Candidatus Saccharimonadales bacterium]